MSRAALACLLPLLASGAVYAQSNNGEHSTFDREARVTISPEGKITALQFVNTKATKDVLGERLDPVIRTWSFEPGQVDGKPAATETTLHVHLDMRKTGADSYAITLLGAETGVGQDKIAAPAYPSVQLKNNVEAKLALLITVSTEGNPEDIRVERIQSSGGSSDNVRFEQASIAVAKKWTYRPEVVGGHAMTSVVRVPIEFCIDDHFCRSSQGPAGAPAGTPSTSVATLDSHAKLVTQVAGTTL